MKNKTWVRPLLLIACGAALATGCVEREVRYRNPPPPQGEMVVTEAPPAPIVEVQTVAPDPTFVWVGGGYVWRGGGWVWEPGRWAHPPHPGAVWYGPRYAYRGGRHVYVRGYWR